MFKVACLIIAALTYTELASAGFLIDSSHGSMIGPFSSLLISSAGFFFRGPRRASPILYIKESEIESGKIYELLKKNYVGLSDELAKKLELKIKEKNKKTPSNGKIKEIIFDIEELDECLISLKEQNLVLYQNIINDLNKKTIQKEI